MNYVELHIGDYDKATAHLTACEDGIYGRLIRWYYDIEGPLPLDTKVIQRRVRARSRDEKAAVESVLEEFFEQADDGWHHKRCDEEIAKYQGKREKAQRSANARWDAKRKDSDGITSAYADGMRTHSDGNAHQSPVTSHHQEQKPAPHAPSSPDTPAQPPPATEAGRACLLLRQAGCARVNPSNPDLLAALAEGVTPEAIRDTYGEKPDATNPFAWAITTARSRHAEGPKQISTGPPNSRQPSDSKTFTGLKKLQGLKTHETLPTRVAAERDPGRLIEAHDPES